MIIIKDIFIILCIVLLVIKLYRNNVYIKSLYKPKTIKDYIYLGLYEATRNLILLITALVILFNLH